MLYWHMAMKDSIGRLKDSMALYYNFIMMTQISSQTPIRLMSKRYQVRLLFKVYAFIAFFHST